MLIFELIKAIFLGIIEGITEWLPISSTGHLILFDEFFPLTVGKNIHPDFSSEFMSMFEVVIQMGAIMAVVVLFWNKLPVSPKIKAGPALLQNPSILLASVVLIAPF